MTTPMRWRAKTLTVASLACAFLVLAVPTAAAPGNVTVYVCDAGDSSNPASGDTATAYPVIQAAINALDPGDGADTVIVYSSIIGDSYCGNVVLDSGMTLISCRALYGIDTGGGADTYPIIAAAVNTLVAMGEHSSLNGFILNGIDSTVGIGRKALYLGDVGDGAIGNCTVTNIIIHDCRNGVRLDWSNGNTLTNIICYRTLEAAFYLVHAAGNMISNTRCWQNNLCSYLLDYSDTNTLLGNECFGNYNNGFYLSNSNGNQFLGNRSYQHRLHGFLLYPGSNNVLIGNTFSDNGVGYANGIGLYIQLNSENNVIRENEIYRNAGFGICFSAYSTRRPVNNVVIANSIHDNGQNNVMTYDNSTDNIISGNQIFGISNYAFYLNSGLIASRITKNNILPATGNGGVYNQAIDTPLVFTGNYWYTTNEDSLAALMMGTNADSVCWLPYRLGMVDTAPGADSLAPASPTGLGIATAAGQVTIRWSAVTRNEDGSSLSDLVGYRVYRHADTAGIQKDWKENCLLATVSDALFIDKTGIEGATYYYRVTAYDNHSPWENESWFSDTLTACFPSVLRVDILIDSEGLTQSADTFLLSGTVRYNQTDTPSQVTITLNGAGASGVTVDTASGTFSKVLHLVRGLNIIRATVPDMFGISGYDEVGISRVDSIYRGDSLGVVMSDTAGAIISLNLLGSDSAIVTVADMTGGDTFVAEIKFVQPGCVVSIELVDETTVQNVFEPLALGFTRFRLTDDVIFRFTAMDSAGGVIGDNATSYNGVTLTWHYNVPPGEEANLHINYFDHTDSTWKLATDAPGLAIAWPNGDPAGERQDMVADTISIRVSHLSIWGIFVGAGFDVPVANLSNVTVYPNPYIPDDGDPANGIPYAGQGDGSGIYMNGLVPGTRIRIFDLRGREVEEMTVPAGTGAVQWDVRNKGGEEVASGVYIAVFENGGERVTRKIIVVR